MSDERIFIDFSVKELATLGIDRTALLRALEAQNVVRPGGSIETGKETLSVRVSGAFRSEEDIANVNFAIGERMLRLSDIAVVRRGFADPPQPQFRIDGKPAIGLAVAMREGGDILALGQNIKRAMIAATGELPIGIDAKLVTDQAVTVERAISEFMNSLWQAVAIILGVSLISLGVRPGLIIAISIPLTLAMVFSVMELTGIDMQRISLGALIIALALLVDDAMTVTDATLSRLALGDSKLEAASYAFGAYAFPMLAGTLVTIAGFLPVGFAASSAGEYTFSLFAVVSIALLASWLVAVIFAPLIASVILKPDQRGGPSDASPGPMLAAYRRLLSAALRYRRVTLSVTALLFIAALAVFPLIPNQFFPSSDRPELLVDVRLPQNASIFATETAAKRLDALLENDPDVERWSTYVGRGAIRFYLPLDVQLPNAFLAQAVVVAKDLQARQRLQEKLERTLAESFPSAVARISPLELGPPVGWPVQYRVSGPDIEEVRTIAFRLGGAIAAEPLARQVNFDWIEPEREIRVAIDQDEARRLGLSTEALASALNTTFSGQTVTQVRDDIYLIDVVTRSLDEQRVSVATLRDLQVPLRDGRTVALNQVARLEYAQSYPVVWRRDRLPTLTVQANVQPGALPATVVESARASNREAAWRVATRLRHRDGRDRRGEPRNPRPRFLRSCL